MNTSLASKTDILIDRAALLNQARAFFAARSVLEVDCPALSKAACVDLHIDVMKVLLTDHPLGYLHTSPEYGMKRLLATGIGDIYQMSHVFRDGEIGRLHNPEFTMVEWYRQGITFTEMIEETLEFIRLFLGSIPSTTMSYRQMVQQYLGIDYVSATTDSLIGLAQEKALDLPKDAQTFDKDTLLQLLISCLIEPHLGQEELFVLAYFPASQAALSKVTYREGESVACRFEVYYRGMELANGYDELTDAKEQKRRFHASNEARAHAGKDVLKIDDKFLEALEQGLPECCGVAVGFDRLMLLRHGKSTLRDVLPFSWEET